MKTDKQGNIILIEKRFMPAEETLSPFYYVGETFGQPEPQQEEPCNKPIGSCSQVATATTEKQNNENQ